MKRLLLLGCVLVLLLLGWGGCDTAEQQRDFEDEAFSTPSGYTSTDENGEIIAEDKDDWRTAPAYNSRILVDPAFPNPTAPGDNVTVPVQVFEFNAVGGALQLVSFDENRIPRRLDDTPDAGNPGAYVLRFSPAVLGVRGLIRLFILDSRGDLVSYGDVFIDS